MLAEQTEILIDFVYMILIAYVTGPVLHVPAMRCMLQEH